MAARDTAAETLIRRFAGWRADRLTERADRLAAAAGRWRARALRGTADFEALQALLRLQQDPRYARGDPSTRAHAVALLRGMTWWPRPRRF